MQINVLNVLLALQGILVLPVLKDILLRPVTNAALDTIRVEEEFALFAVHLFPIVINASLMPFVEYVQPGIQETSAKTALQPIINQIVHLLLAVLVSASFLNVISALILFLVLNA